SKPEHIDWNAKFQDLELCGFAHHRVTAVAADHEVRPDFNLRSAASPRLDSCDLFSIANQIDSLMLHSQIESGKFHCLSGKKVQKIPLRHQRDKLAMCGY